MVKFVAKHEFARYFACFVKGLHALQLTMFAVAEILSKIHFPLTFALSTTDSRQYESLTHW